MPEIKDMTAVLQEIASSSTPVFLSAESTDIVFQTTIKDSENGKLTLENNVPIDKITEFLDAKRFFIQAQLIRLETEEIQSDGVNIVFPLSSLSMKEDNRGAKRVFFDQKDDVYLEVVNPYDGETVIKRPIIDISNTGISIKSPTASKLYNPGTKFLGMKVLVIGEIYNEVSGQVIYHRKFLDLKGKYYYQIGFQFDKPVQN